MMRAPFSITIGLLLILGLGHQYQVANAHAHTHTLRNIANHTSTSSIRHRRLCSAQTTCANGACCSQWGFCGYSDAHCGSSTCVSGCPSTIATNPPSPPPTPSPPPPSPPTPNANKIINGNFEEGLYPWYANSNIGTIQLDTTTFHSGSQSCLVSNRNTGTWNGVEQNILSTNNGVTGVIPNERYYISTYIKLKDSTTTLPQTVRITIRIKDTNGIEDWIGISKVVSSSNEWTLVEDEVTISTNNVGSELEGIYLYINGPDVGIEYWVDDVDVVLVENDSNSPSKGPTLSPTTFSPTFPSSNLILNPKFNNNDIFSNWEAKSAGSISVDSTIYHSSPQSAKCYNRSAKTHGIQQSILGRLIPNAKYYLSVWVRLNNAPEGSSSSQLVKLKVKFVDDTGSHWRGISSTLSGSDINNVWSKLEGFVTIQTVGEISAAKIFVDGPDTGIDFYVDDFVMDFVEVVTVEPTSGPSKIPTLSPTSLSPTSLPSSHPTTSSPTSLSPSYNPTTSPQTSIPLSPGSCPHDVFNNDICCLESCGTCGGSGCGSLPGGGSNCCSSKIRDSGVLCLYSDPPCIISEEPSVSPTDIPTHAPVTLAPITPFPTVSRVPTNSPTSSLSTNLAINPGFEGSDPWEDDMIPWYAYGGTVEIDTTVSHSGTQSVLCKDRTASWMGVEQEMTSGERVVANAKYRVSCWVKLKNSISDSFKITMRVEDDVGLDWRGITRSVTDEWTLVEGFLTVQNVVGALNGVYMYLNGPAVGIEYWVDDITVEFVESLTISPSNSPTPLSTPSPTNLPVTTDRMLYCGVPSKCETLGGDEVVANMNDQHVVRCCTENTALNWSDKCLTIEGVFGTTPNECYMYKTFSEAMKICSSYDGGRLCSGEEMKDKCTAGTGCAANAKLAWGCTVFQGNCVADAECCSGRCNNQGVCTDVSPPPSEPTTYSPTNADTALPTPPPSPPPSPPPTQPPSYPPTPPSLYIGPFVTHETSSDIVTIPRPPVPNLNEPKSNCPHQETGLLSWHNPNTWGGQVPSSGDVTLPSNSKVIITQRITSELGVITVPSSSELIFDENTSSPITLDVAGMDVQGALRAGSETCRYSTELIITLHGSRPTDLNIYGQSSTAVPTYKGISVNGGIISMHGKQYYPTWTRLAKSVSAGQSYLLVQEQVNWEAGQEIVLTTTAIHDSREWHKNEVLTIDYIINSPVSGVGSAIHFTTPAAHEHIANNGYQAEVGLLTRNIRVQGAEDDSDPTDTAGSCTDRNHFGSNLAPCPNKYKTGFGGHIMVHSGGKGYVQGVELYRMGQTNVLGRYPFHYHNLDNDCSDCYFKENSIHKSYYRCISIHGTHSTTVSENVGYDITGYCYYLEDGVEEDNILSFNLAAHIHPVSNIVANAGGGQYIPVFAQSKDLINPADVTSSGFYITNLNNYVYGNACSGGWAGYALPVLHSPIGSHKNVNMRPGNRHTKTFDGNTAHSTGWWWSHAGAIYSGGSLYYSSNYPSRLEYNAGRDQAKGNRSPCLTDYCVVNGDCGSYCFEGERAWYQLSNSKIFLTASSGLSSWSGGMEINGFEAHDVELGLESLSAIGFGINNFLVECRSGEDWDMPGNPNQVNANGFKWYDTNQEHIITTATFKNCGARRSDNVYDSSSTRGCSTNSVNGCTSSSSVWSFVTHSDEHTPEVMQATSDVTYIDCGRRFRLYDYADNNNPSSVSGRTQNWMDVDGSTSGLNVPTIIGSGLSDTGHWFRVEDEVIYDPEGPLYFIKKDNGPERSLGHIRLRFDDALYNSVGKTSCMNGPKGTTQNNAHTLCPTIGRIRHLGPKFDISNDSTGGLPITANAIVSGPTGGFGWVLNLDAGPPKSIRIDQIEIQDVVSPLILAIPYPQGTGFTVTAMVPWCTPSLTHSCTEQFTPASSLAEVRYSEGNKYFYDNASNMLFVRIIMAPQTYTGDNLYSPSAEWHMWDMDDLNNKQYDKRVHALDRYSFNDITLAKYNTASYLQIEADCNPSSSSKYCTNTPAYIEPQVCPPGYVQVAYDKCCVSAGSSTCYDFTAPPTRSPTSPPTFGVNSNLFYNPSFEEGTLTPWYANGGTIQLDHNVKHGSGTTSVLCKSRTATWMGVEQDMLVGGGRFVAGNTYHISFWAKLKNSGSATVKFTMKASYNNGSPVYSGISKNLNNYSWNLIGGDITLNGGGTLTEAKLYVNGPQGGVEFWVDELSAVLV